MIKIALYSSIARSEITRIREEIATLNLSPDAKTMRNYRKKIIHNLMTNYHKKKSTTISSKNLYINLLNVIDIVNAIKIILKA